MPIEAHAPDSPWLRLPILLPLSFLLCLLALIRLLPHPDDKLEPLSPPPPPIVAEIVELPPEAPPAPKPLATPVPTRSASVTPHPESVPTPPSTPATIPSQPAPTPPSSSPPSPVSKPTIPSPPAPSSTGHGQSEIRAARALIHPLPVIPDELRASALNETATARFHIDRSGHASVELIHATQNTRLNRLILDTLSTWKFFPAIADGSPIDSNQDLDIHINVQ